ncbi:MAG: hypothetical protein DSZ30_03920 [Aquificaceae bacterium]|nr:MAG: hypothetical protein DSZ30_03920 [Aquificaceae bacterium]
MAKVIKWNPEGDKNRDKPQKEEKEKKPQPLTEEDFKRLFEPFKEGLKKLYPSQVEDVLGFYGMGEKSGNRDFLVGIVLWKRYGVEQPYSSTFVAIFEDNKLQKVSFLEAKNNYWDWRVMLKTYKKEFHTEEIFNRFMELVRGQFRV